MMSRRSSRVAARLAEWERELIDRGAEAIGESRSEFLRTAGLKRATDLLEDDITAPGAENDAPER